MRSKVGTETLVLPRSAKLKKPFVIPALAAKSVTERFFEIRKALNFGPTSSIPVTRSEGTLMQALWHVTFLKNLLLGGLFSAVIHQLCD